MKIKIPISIRSADDILICCDSVGQAQHAYHDPEKSMTAAGMLLIGNEATAIVDLKRNQTADWLGYQLGYKIDEIPTNQELHRRWQAAFDRWNSIWDKFRVAKHTAAHSFNARMRTIFRKEAMMPVKKKVKKLKLPLKWHGGKNYLAPKFVDLMPPHLHYVEPYAGGLPVVAQRSSIRCVRRLHGE